MKSFTEFLADDINNTFEYIQESVDEMVNAHGHMGYTPLHKSINPNNPSITKKLIDNGADVNAVNRDGETALHLALIRNRYLDDDGKADNHEIIKTLLNAGANPNIHERSKNTPLHYACNGRITPDIVHTLLQHGADPNAKDYAEETPLHRIVNADYDKHADDIINHLMTHGANPFAENERGITPFFAGDQHDCKTMREHPAFKRPVAVTEEMLTEAMQGKPMQPWPNFTHDKASKTFAKDAFKKFYTSNIEPHVNKVEKRFHAMMHSVKTNSAKVLAARQPLDSLYKKVVDEGNDVSRQNDVLRGAILTRNKQDANQVVDNIKKSGKLVSHNVEKIDNENEIHHVTTNVHGVNTEIKVMQNKMWNLKQDAGKINKKYSGMVDAAKHPDYEKEVKKSSNPFVKKLHKEDNE